jgi:hypothetical protein
MMLVKVTQKHIYKAKSLLVDNGNRGCNCPVALALSEARNNITRVAAYKYFNENKFPHEFGMPLPQEAIEWYKAFDRGEDVKPFEFEIHE